jgi:hypothetical protein
MIEFFKYIFSDFWIFLGFIIIVGALLEGIEGIVRAWKCK